MMEDLEVKAVEVTAAASLIDPVDPLSYHDNHPADAKGLAEEGEALRPVDHHPVSLEAEPTEELHQAPSHASSGGDLLGDVLAHDDGSEEAPEVQKLQARIKELEQHLSDCRSQLHQTDMHLRKFSSRHQELLALGGPTLTNVWLDLCAGKVVTSPLVVTFGSQDGDAEGVQAARAANSNPNIIIEHLSVSGAKAKLAQQQLLAMGSQSFHIPPGGTLPSPAAASRGRTLDRQASIGGPSGIPIHTTSRRSVRRVDTTSGAGAPGSVRADSVDTGVSSPSTGRPEHQLASCEDQEEEEDSRLLDIDDLLGEVPPGSHSALYEQHSTGFEEVGVQVDALSELHSTACGSDLPLPVLADGASQTAVQHELVDVYCQSESSTQEAGVQVTQELPQLVCSSSQYEPVDMQHTSVQAGSEAGEQQGLDAMTQTAADSTDVCVQATTSLLHTATSMTDLTREAEAAQEAATGLTEQLEAAQQEVAAARQEAAFRESQLASAQTDLQLARQQHAEAVQQVQVLTSQLEELSVQQAAGGVSSREVDTCTEEVAVTPPVSLQLLVRSGSMEGRVCDLEEQLAAQGAEVEEARTAAAESARALQQAEEQLQEAKAALADVLSKVEALQEAEGHMQRELEAYEHTLDGLRVAVEAADVEKQLKDAQNLELAKKLASVTEFVNFKAKNPKHAVMDYAAWLRQQAKAPQGKENVASGE